MDLWLLVVLLIVVQPVLGHYRFTRLTARPGAVSTRGKLRLYLSVVVTQWLLVAGAAWVLARRGLDFRDLGLASAPATLPAVVTAMVTIALCASTMISLRGLARDPFVILPAHLRRVGRILPVNARERAGYLVVSLTAGICEEILYRGFLIFAFDRVLPSSAVSAAVAAALFGGAHAYQGPRGMLSTGLLGGFLGGLYLWSGSLWPGIVLHVAVDVVNGLALGPVARAREYTPSAPWPAPPSHAPPLLGEPGAIARALEDPGAPGL